MKKSVTIQVVVDNREETITIEDSAGNSKELKSVMVIGGAHEESGIYCFTGGSSSDLGWSLGAMWRFTRMSKRLEEAHLRKAFNQFMAWCCTFLGIPMCQKSIDPKTLLERLEKEDEEKAVRESTNVMIH